MARVVVVEPCLDNIWQLILWVELYFWELQSVGIVYIIEREREGVDVVVAVGEGLQQPHHQDNSRSDHLWRSIDLDKQ